MSLIKLYRIDTENPPAVEGDGVYLGVDENGVPVVVLPGGEVNPIAGSGGAPTLNWKGGTPGNPYIVGDTAFGEHNSIVYFDMSDPDVATLNLPAITPESGGLRVMARNIVNKKKTAPGLLHVQPAEGDQVEELGEGVLGVIEDDVVYFDLESDGVGTWRLVSWGAPAFATPA